MHSIKLCGYRIGTKFDKYPLAAELQLSTKKLETENILIDGKNYIDLTIYFTRYLHSNSINLFSLHYHELIGKTEEHEGKKMFDG